MTGRESPGESPLRPAALRTARGLVAAGVCAAVFVSVSVVWTGWQGSGAVVRFALLGTGALVAAAGGLLALRAGERPVPAPADAGMLLYALSVLVAALAAKDRALALSGMRAYWDGAAAAAAVVAVYLAMRAAFGAQASAGRALRGALWAASAVIVVQSLSALSPQSWAAGRFGGLLGQPVFLAGWLVMWLVPVTAAAISMRMRTAEGIAFAVAGALGTAMLLATQSRAGWIGASVAFGMYVALAGGTRARVRAALAAVLVVAVLGGVLIVAVRSETGPLGARVVEGLTDDGTAVTRAEAWRSAVRAWREHPAFGTGPGTFAYTHRRMLSRKAFSVERDGQMADAHDWYLNAFATAGSPAGLAALAIAALCVGAAVRARGRAGGRLAAACGAAGYAVHCAFTPNVPPVFASLAVVLALAVGLAEPREAEASARAWLPAAAVALAAFGLLGGVWSWRALAADATFGTSLERFDDAGMARAVRMAPEVSRYGIVRVAYLGSLAKAAAPGSAASEEALSAARLLAEDHPEDSEALASAGTALVSASWAAYGSGDAAAGRGLATEARGVLTRARDLAPLAIETLGDLAAADALAGDEPAARAVLATMAGLLGAADSRVAEATAVADRALGAAAAR